MNIQALIDWHKRESESALHSNIAEFHREAAEYLASLLEHVETLEDQLFPVLFKKRGLCPLRINPANHPERKMESVMAMEEFKAKYETELAKQMAKRPDDYMLLDAKLVAERMCNAIAAKGIGGVNINSPTFRALAKQYGIKNTYTAWREIKPWE